MQRKTLLPLAALIIVAGSLFGQDVRYNFDKSADFTKYKTYKWVELKDAPKVDSLVETQIKNAFDAGLATKGLTRTDSDTADLFIGYQAAVGQEKQFTSYSSDWGYGGGWGRGGWYGGGMGSTWTTGETSTIYTGQLALDMYDQASKSLVWRGVASKTLDTKAKPEKREKNLAKAVAKVLKNYPPRAKK